MLLNDVWMSVLTEIAFDLEKALFVLDVLIIT